MYDLIVDEGKWLAFSMTVALLSLVALQRRLRCVAGMGERECSMALLNLFFGTMIGVMAFGHLLAVAAKLLAGQLVGSTPAYFAIGVALAAPSWWLIHHSWRSGRPRASRWGRGLVLNVWLVLTLLALGLHNLPLATPGILNVLYRLNRRPVVGRVILVIALFVALGLFAGSLVFLASGQSFEQFRSMESSGIESSARGMAGR